MPYFEENRLNGENEMYICSLIRQDSVEEFISHAHKENVNLSKMRIQNNSIFETNPLLMKQSATLIEYAAFYGSIKIFNYLQKNDVEITPSLWFYAIHSNNAEMIYLLEELNIKYSDNYYELFLEESIKCHHNEFASHFYDNLIDEKKENFLKNILRYGFKYNNYFFINDIENEYMFYYSCEFGYINLVNLFLKSTKIDINKEISINEIKGIENEVVKFTGLKLAAKNDSQNVLNFLLSQEGIKIGKECFKGCSELTEITLPSTIDKISEKCFCDCTKLKKINIPLTVKTIEYKSFDNCKSLEELVIPASVKSIENCIISNCYSLKRLTIPVSLLSRKIDDHLKLLYNENCEYEEIKNDGKHNILRMTNLITGEAFIIKNIPTSYYVNKEYEFFNRVSLYNLEFPSLIPVDSYLLPLFTNGEDDYNLSEIKVINESGDTIYQGFGGYIVVSKFIENHGTLEKLKEEYIESFGIRNEKMNPTIKHKALFGIASAMNLFSNFESAFLNLSLDNVLIDTNFEPRIGFHAAQNFDQFTNNNPNKNYFYIAPEVIVDEADEYADIYSFAFIIYLMFTNSVSFNGIKKYTWQGYLMKVGRELRPEKPENISDDYWDLIQVCWSVNLDARPPFDQIVNYLIDIFFYAKELRIDIDFKQFDEYSKKFADFNTNLNEFDGSLIKRIQRSDDFDEDAFDPEK